jgi:predicted Rossmann fold flavoprotein
VNNHYDAIVIGAGAAGLMTAITAGRLGRRVLVLDHANKAGKKILMSGGGRCNFTNMYSGPENFLSANPHFCKSALARYTPWDFIALVNDYEIAYHEKTLGQLFCDNSSKDILNMLLAEAEKVAVEIRLNTEIHSVEKNDAGFELNTAAGQFTVPRLVIATGGLSIPKMGATGFGYQIAKQFGLKTEPTRAGLVPLTLSGKPLEAIAPLSGLALTAVKVSSNDGQVFEEAMLCTHRGISGPAVLQISSFWQPGETVLVDLLPNVDAEAWLAEMVAEQPKAELRTVLAYKLPKRFAEMLCQQYGSPRLNSLNEKQLLEWAARLHAWEIKPSGTEGYRTAEVTLGGVSTDELSSKTMECKTVPGLYFVGEVVDVTGHLGGHNFQWAWASAHAAGEAVAGVA